MALPLLVYIVVSALSLEDRHGQTLIHSDYSILLDLVNQYHSTPVIHMPLQLSIRHAHLLKLVKTESELQETPKYFLGSFIRTNCDLFCITILPV